jgi:predicted Zn-dependent peptidase
VLGHRSTIEALTRDQLAAYHAGRYRPERMTLLLCGPVEDDAVLEEIEEHFRWENGAPDIRASKPEKTEWGDGAIHIVSREISESHLAVAWPAPAASDTKGMLAMDVAQFVLGQGRASRLYQRLHEQERLVTTIGLTYPPHVEEGLFIVIATCQPDKVQRAQEVIVEEVAGLAERKPRADEARRAKRLLTNQHIFSRETTTGQTASMGYHLILTGDLEFDEKYIDLMNRVTVPAITKAAQEWLSPERAVTVVVQPKDHPLEWEGATEEVPR